MTPAGSTSGSRASSDSRPRSASCSTTTETNGFMMLPARNRSPARIGTFRRHPAEAGGAGPAAERRAAHVEDRSRSMHARIAQGGAQHLAEAAARGQGRRPARRDATRADAPGGPLSTAAASVPAAPISRVLRSTVRAAAWSATPGSLSSGMRVSFVRPARAWLPVRRWAWARPGPGGRRSRPAPPRPARRPRGAATPASWGRYQFQSPSSFIDGGQQHAADDRRVDQHGGRQSEPHLLEVEERERHEDEEHADHHGGGARDRSGGRRDSALDGLVGGHAAVVELPDAREDEHVVVHRQPEQDDEQEQRQPVRHPAVGGEAEQATRRGPAGRRSRARRRPRPPTAGSAGSP